MNNKEIILNENAPKPIGCYSQAIIANKTLYVSGQIAINPKTGNLIIENIEQETTQALENLKTIVLGAGYEMNQIVKCSIFVTNINQFEKINKVYSKYFDKNNAPARELVEVKSLPKFVNFEISAIAVQ